MGGPFYKSYQFAHRYFFVAKMLAEILSGIIIGIVSHVPTQLTLLMSLQLCMFLYTVHKRPFIMPIQSLCSSVAFVLKMVMYSFMSSFLMAHSHSPRTRN